MRHKKGYNRLGRGPSHRRAMLRNMATSLILNEKMDTTLTKAKSIRPVVEKIVTLGRKGGLHAHRQAASYLFDKSAAHKVFSDLGPRFADRPGGYLRILKMGKRFGDGAEMARIEFVDRDFNNKANDSSNKKENEESK